jgi:hypothetical protein
MRPDAAAASPRSGVRRGISSISIASREVITRGLPRSMSFGSTDLLLSWEISAMGQRLVRDKNFTNRPVGLSKSDAKGIHYNKEYAYD